MNIKRSTYVILYFCIFLIFLAEMSFSFFHLVHPTLHISIPYEKFKLFMTQYVVFQTLIPVLTGKLTAFDKYCPHSENNIPEFQSNFQTFPSKSDPDKFFFFATFFCYRAGSSSHLSSSLIFRPDRSAPTGVKTFLLTTKKQFDQSESSNR